jgi:hypothetical protein
MTLRAKLYEATRRPRHALVVRDADAGRHFELFFIAAVATVLVIRAFLALTHYPQLGAGRLHVAHMLWGGLALGAALLLVLLSVSRRAKPIAALVGGAGFGFFIDELGKFLTRDNDYFYQPAIALIYVLFVALFLVVRAMLSSRALDSGENLVNAIALLKDAALEDLDATEKARALELLSRCDPADPRAARLRALFGRLDVIPVPPHGPYTRLKRWLGGRLETVLGRPEAPHALSMILVAQAVLAFIWAFLTARALWTLWRAPAPGLHFDPGLMSWGRIAATFLGGAFIVAGALQLLRSRARAYRSYRRALHVSLLLTQFFVFYESQLAGLVSLGFNLGLLGVVQHMLRREQVGLGSPARVEGRPPPDAVVVSPTGHRRSP